MTFTVAADTDWTGGNPELIDLSLKCRPMIAPDVVWRSFDHGVVVWGHSGAPVVLSPHQAVAWPYFDGSVTAGQLAEELSEASGLPLDVARAEVAGLVVRAFSVSWIYEVEALGNWFAAQDEPPDRPEASRTWVREIDGVRWCYMEVTRSAGEAQEIIDGRTSLAELWPPDTCGGRGLHLDRPAERLTLDLPGASIAVRVGDPELATWVSALPERSDRHAPVLVFVAASTPEPDRPAPVRYRLANGVGHLVAVPVGLDEAKRTLASMALERVALASTPPTGWFVEARSVSVDDAAVLTMPASIDGGSHLLNHLRRAGAGMDPMSTVVLEPDGRSVRVPDPARALDWLEAGATDDVWSEDLWQRRRITRLFLPVGMSVKPPAERAAEVLRGTAARPAPRSMQGLLDATAALLAAVPVAERANPEQSPLTTARQLRRLLP